MEPRFPVDAPWNQNIHWWAWLFLVLTLAFLFVPLTGIVRTCRKQTIAEVRAWVMWCVFALAAQLIALEFMDALTRPSWEIRRTPEKYYSVPAVLLMLTSFMTAVGYLATADRSVLRRFTEALIVEFVLLGPLFLVCVLLPMDLATEWAPQSQCRNNLKQFFFGASEFKDAYAGRWLMSQEGPSPMSWRVAILPFIDQSHIRQQYKDGEPWNSAANTAIARQAVAVYQCPSHIREQDAKQRYLTDYVMVSGPGTISSLTREVQDDEITDGLSYTMLFAEASGLRIVWTEPRDVDVSQTPITINQAGNDKQHSPSLTSSYHARGSHIAMADGSVKFINNDIDPVVLQAMTTISGGEQDP